MQSAYDEGFQAARDGLYWDRCPYHADSTQRDDWFAGWDAYTEFHVALGGAS